VELVQWRHPEVHCLSPQFLAIVVGNTELGVTAETGVGDKKFMTDKTKSEQLLRRDIVLASPSQLCVLGIAFSQSNNRYHRKGEMPRCSQTLLAEPC
jgi:hypothetical protein